MVTVDDISVAFVNNSDLVLSSGHLTKHLCLEAPRKMVS
jgi:hypothetical protein